MVCPASVMAEERLSRLPTVVRQYCAAKSPSGTGFRFTLLVRNAHDDRESIPWLLRVEARVARPPEERRRAPGREAALHVGRERLVALRRLGGRRDERALEAAQPSAPHPLWPPCSVGAESEQRSGERYRIASSAISSTRSELDKLNQLSAVLELRIARGDQSG